MLMKKPKVAKCFKSDLRNSRFEMARKMAGKYIKGEKPFKYLTEDQAYQVRSYNITYYPLTKDEFEIVNSKLENKSKRSKKSKVKEPCTVIYRDNDGIHTASFDDVEDAKTWIEFQKNIARYSGEIFELI